ncbi:MAG: penicillin-binding protein 2 [Bacteroidetes bacterium]|uniref:Penicillin-binding protein 2 n=1 Tax=Phaeocystidibacter marisrubri TaxID=1577780 RepID=A0A6L3ZDV4_9FLAO|nr:penicillin-binding protein 2 [Phaeocystidibacter marisrubri]KAB2815806.1 penicillin-binding protein 2 [Phaeocystidibacter marisrubri]TNE28541.1 MAG: penicillin-binding protein 2 [Bacteroidota bacterium]GGH65803.1 penicillin-binding protein 2 [Phaeocystidibacter marisrubri]
MRRDLLFYFLFATLGIIFLWRLFSIQVLDATYKLSAEDNAKREVKLYPSRGYIYDRNGELLVANQVGYDVMVIPRQVEPFDTALLCNLLDVDTTYVLKYLDKARRYSPYQPSVFYGMMSDDRYARIQEELYKFKGFYTQKRVLRDYPIHGAGNVVGFIGEVNERFIRANPGYSMGDLTGQGGIDKSYEEVLRGKAGRRYILVDNHNREVGSFMDGKYDTLPVPGKDVVSTIDIKLQQLGEELMRGKRGSIVAIEPSTGEILALVSAPTYDPNLLVGRQRSVNYTRLYRDSINKPLFDRGLLAEYPPGSPFKIVNALIGLQEGTLHPYTHYTCHGGFHFGRLHVGCHCGGGSMALRKSIEKSCNNYYCNVFKRIIENYPSAQEGMNAWSNHVKSFGLGQFLNNDLPTGRRGLVPTADYYDRAFGYTGWKAVSTISLAIGQGEMLVTPIQLANMTAAVANRGYYYTPHIVKSVDGQPLDDPQYTVPKYTTVDSAHFPVVIEGMFDVFEHGTARASRIESIEICGKTGTAENPHGQDHSIFIAFAPKDNPKIAIAIVVENGYWGSRWAAPIASLLTEYYLTGEISRESMYERMINGSLSEEYRKQFIELYGNDSLYVEP